MFLNTLKINAKWRLKHELFRRVLPTLQYEPNAIRHLSYEAWPKIATLTAKQDFPEGIESVDWRAINLPDDGSEMIKARARNSTPLILRNYADGCPPASWSMDTLKSEFGREKVTVRAGDYISEFGQPRNISMRLGDFIDYLHGRAKFPRQNLLVDGLDPYVGNQLMPALADQLPRPDFFSPRKNADSSQRDLVTFWLGSANAKTPLHCHHFCDTFVIQLIGRRNFTLIPPDQALMVGYMPQNINIGMAAFDPYAPTKTNFPVPTTFVFSTSISALVTHSCFPVFGFTQSSSLRRRCRGVVLFAAKCRQRWAVGRSDPGVMPAASFAVFSRHPDHFCINENLSPYTRWNSFPLERDCLRSEQLH